jgi:hypothetical protein
MGTAMRVRSCFTEGSFAPPWPATPALPPSTGVYRLRRAGGDQSNLRVGDLGKVPRGVQVPIQHQPAGLAAELAHPERKHRLDASAAGTPLGRGEEPGRDHQPRPIPRALVRKLPVELAPPLIADRTSKTPIADHARHMQVLHHDHRLGFRQRRSGLVECIGSLVANATMAPGQRQDRLAAVPGAWTLPTDRPRVMAQLALASFQCSRTVDRDPIGADREPADPAVHSYNWPVDRLRIRPLHLYRQCHVPAVSLPAAGRR